MFQPRNIERAGVIVLWQLKPKHNMRLLLWQLALMLTLQMP